MFKEICKALSAMNVFYENVVKRTFAWSFQGTKHLLVTEETSLEMLQAGVAKYSSTLLYF